MTAVLSNRQVPDEAAESPVATNQEPPPNAPRLRSASLTIEGAPVDLELSYAASAQGRSAREALSYHELIFPYCERLLRGDQPAPSVLAQVPVLARQCSRNSLEAALRELPEITRLYSISQHGVRWTGLCKDRSGGLARSRGQHCDEMHAFVQYVARVVDMPERLVNLCSVFALIHDAGHTSFSHQAEHYLWRRFGFDHDLQLVNRLRRGPLRATIDKYGAELGISADDLLAMQLEDPLRSGQLGHFAKEVLDRCAYLLVDIARAQFSSTTIRPLLLQTVDNTLRRVRLDPSGAFAIDATGGDAEEALFTVKRLLALRHMLHEQINHHPAATLCTNVVAAAIADLFESGELGDCSGLDSPGVQRFLSLVDDEAIASFRQPYQAWFSRDRLGGCSIEQHFETLGWCTRIDLAEEGQRGFFDGEERARAGEGSLRRALEQQLATFLPKGSFFVCATPDISRRYMVPLLLEHGRVPWQLECTAHDDQRHLFAVVARDLDERLQRRAKAVFTDVVLPFLRPHGQLREHGLFDRVVDSAYFLEVPGSGSTFFAPPRTSWGVKLPLKR